MNDVIAHDRSWVNESIRKIEADFARSGDTHLIRLDLPGLPDIDLYLKDESIHPTGSLKHRLARSLFLYAMCNGWIGPNTLIIESSSGNTAVSEAYFARLLGLKFVAVVPADTSPEKIEQIEFYGGQCKRVDPSTNPSDECRRLAAESGGHFMDQFTYAERATDWRGNNNVAESIFAQMRHERHPVPKWVVCAAGTGGTSATIGRYIRYQQLATHLCVADPENSVYFDAHRTGRRDLVCPRGPGVEGIGRPRVEPSFIPSVIDRCVRVPNAASFGAMHYLEQLTRRKYGGSTGTNLYAAAGLIAEMATAGEGGSIVTIICDLGDRYLSTYYDDDWLARNGHDIQPPMRDLKMLFSGPDA
ncbi:MAG: cysK [Phycisphaerales bacterium]|nr:cysK [Phycisphaerales bacterium]